jgi:hypothetical protein
MGWREELAWAAGFFDGEGTVGGYCKDGEVRINFVLKVYQTERSTLERFKAAVWGLGTVYGPYFRKDRKAYHKPSYHYGVTGHRNVQAVVAMLWPFLSAPKKEQVRKALQRLPLAPEQARVQLWTTRRSKQSHAI